MAMSTMQIRDLLLPGLSEVFGDYDHFPSQWSDIFERHTSEMAYERDVEVKMLGLAQLRAEGQATAFEDPGQRFVYVYRHVGVALGFICTKFAIRDNLYRTQFGPNTRALKFSLAQTKEVYGANVLNNAQSAAPQFAGGDGVPLLSVSHPIDVGVVANRPAVSADLNETSLQDAIIAVRRFRDAAGLRVMVQPRKLIIPPDLQFVATRLLRSTLRAGTADNDINALKELMVVPDGFAINDFLTNTRSWFLKTNCPDGLKHFSRDPLETDMFTDFGTDNLMTKATERYSFGWSNFRSIYGSMP
jgi:hypothetical protein